MYLSGSRRTGRILREVRSSNKDEDTCCAGIGLDG